MLFSIFDILVCWSSLPCSMMRLSIFALVLITLLINQEWPFAAAKHVKNKHCPNSCGDVMIKYPFGIGLKCSKDDNFAITCNTSSTKPKPILTKFNLELLESPNLSKTLGSMVVNSPIVRACAVNSSSSSSNNNTTSNEVRWSSLDLSGSPFFFSQTNNVFASVGCDGIASLYNNTGGKVGGCTSTCDPVARNSVDRCNGYYCCKSDFRDDVKRFSIVVTATKGSCRYAFVSSVDFLNTNATVAAVIPNSSVVPVVLDWYPVQKHRNKAVKIFFAYIFPVLCTILVSCFARWSCWWYVTKERRKEVRLRAKYFKEILEKTSSGKEVVEKTKLFTIKELNRATNNFDGDRVVGQGGQGTVYKGMLRNGQVIAVKKSKSFDDNQWRQFINEVVLLSQVNHKNVVKLLGCCLETKVPLVVYEFISNGTLMQHIKNTCNESSLTWEMRVSIASEAADAISYLHSSSSTPIYHRDIKSTNILLDDKFQAKVSDFGISKEIPADQTHLTTCVQGTFGYLDPEYFRSSHYSEKSDVYSFGVILVELLTGQQPLRATTPDGERSLVLYFIESMHEGNLDETLDPMVLQGTKKEEVMVVANLAIHCLKPKGIERPTMKEVAMELETLRNKSSWTSGMLKQNCVDTEYVPTSSALEISNAPISPRSNMNMIFSATNDNFDDHDQQPLSSATS